MTFDKILDNNTLWAVRYDGMADNAFADSIRTTINLWSGYEKENT